MTRAPVSSTTGTWATAGGAAVRGDSGSGGAGLEKSILTVGRGAPASRPDPEITRAPGGKCRGEIRDGFFSCRARATPIQMKIPSAVAAINAAIKMMMSDPEAVPFFEWSLCRRSVQCSV
ncbi:MAG: hypothetical protein KJ726_06170, partial [Verrucomicrobia bacterium]|nr:hypothetical protein [Verrucomicrobiota bacterium]